MTLLHNQHGVRVFSDRGLAQAGRTYMRLAVASRKVRWATRPRGGKAGPQRTHQVPTRSSTLARWAVHRTPWQWRRIGIDA